MTPSPIVIRAMTLADLGEVVRISDQLREAPHWPLESYLAAIDASRTPLRVALVAAPNDGPVLGYCIAVVASPDAEIETIAVAPEHHRQGIARFLLLTLVTRLEELNVCQIYLEVRESNHAAQAFYAAAGFEGAGRRKRYYNDPEEDALILQRIIG